MFNEIWPLISVVLGIVILLVLIIGFKLNTFISLIITSMIVKSRLLCKMLYNVFTISTYQN